MESKRKNSSEKNDSLKFNQSNGCNSSDNAANNNCSNQINNFSYYQQQSYNGYSDYQNFSADSGNYYNSPQNNYYQNNGYNNMYNNYYGGQNNFYGGQENFNYNQFNNQQYEQLMMNNAKINGEKLLNRQKGFLVFLILQCVISVFIAYHTAYLCKTVNSVDNAAPIFIFLLTGYNSMVTMPLGIVSYESGRIKKVLPYEFTDERRKAHKIGKINLILSIAALSSFFLFVVFLDII